ncbi:MAG: phosphoribosylamine--glycine ligase [Planctomycetota bacterium]
MRVLVVGGGGREHALCSAIARSSELEQLFAAPGNPGIASLAQCVDVGAEDIDGLVRLAKERRIDLTVVGPEVPLVAGIADRFAQEGLRLFGPCKSAARLEGSKAFTKELCHKHHIPTGSYRLFDSPEVAKTYLEAHDQFPVVLKADGLAAGKGVIIARDQDEARAAVDSIMVEQAFGAAGARLVVEEFLEGTEASVLAIVDGRTLQLLESARDHKAALDYDRGPNTGGMGAVSPARRVTPHVLSQVESQILVPVVHALARAGKPFRGFLYAGLMLTATGPKVLEFNVRLGDPETQAILPRLQSDLLRSLSLATDGKLAESEPFTWDPRAACCVVLASGGYPGKYQQGMRIEGISQAEELPGVSVFHAGTTQVGTDLLTAGGRVLGVTALGDGVQGACKQAYAAVSKIRFQDAFYRTDIGRAEYEVASE